MTTRDPNNRGNTYPPPLWLASPLAFSAGGRFPGSFTWAAWDCPGGGPRPASGGPGGNEACWIAPPLGRLLGENTRFAQLIPASYGSG
jgi:hypothetical protein